MSAEPQDWDYWHVYPTPELLRAFEDVLDGAAGRLLDMAERELDARIERNNATTKASLSTARVGQGVAAVLTLLAFLASVVFFWDGNEVAGAFMIAMPVLVLIRSAIGRD